MSNTRKEKSAARAGAASEPRPAAGWTFLSNHAHVLVCLSKDASLRVRDIAERVGVTDRAVQHIIVDLEAAGVLIRERVGRRNVYKLITDIPLRHPLEGHRTIKDLLRLA